MPVHEPEWSSTTTDNFSGPNLEDWPEDAQLSDIDDHFVGSRTGFPPDNFGDLAWPLVSPEGELSSERLESANRFVGATDGFGSREKERAREIIRRLARENFDADEVSFLDEEGERNMQEKIEERKKDGIEYRNYRVELRQTDEGNIAGIAVPFNERTDVGGFHEVIRPGAFQKTIQEGDQRALFNHDSNFVLGRRSAGTLTLEERQDGLFYEVDPPNTQWAEDLVTTLERGDVNQASIGMKVQRQNFLQTDDGLDVREVLEAEIRDVGPVTFPAYESSTSELRDQRNKINRASHKLGEDIEELADLILRSERGEIMRTDKQILDRWIERLKSMNIESRATAELIQVEKEKLEMEKEKFGFK